MSIARAVPAATMFSMTLSRRNIREIICTFASHSMRQHSNLLRRQCCAVLRSATQCCYTLPRRVATRSYAVLSRATLSYKELRSASQCNAELRSATQSYAVLRSATLSYAVLLCRATLLRSAMQSYAVLHRATLIYEELRCALLRGVKQSHAERRCATQSWRRAMSTGRS